jgi:hypothetical protein
MAGIDISRYSLCWGNVWEGLLRPLMSHNSLQHADRAASNVSRCRISARCSDSPRWSRSRGATKSSWLCAVLWIGCFWCLSDRDRRCLRFGLSCSLGLGLMAEISNQHNCLNLRTFQPRATYRGCNFSRCLGGGLSGCCFTISVSLPDSSNANQLTSGRRPSDLPLRLDRCRCHRFG